MKGFFGNFRISSSGCVALLHRLAPLNSPLLLSPLPPSDGITPWAADQCTINIYQPGQGIAHHVDTHRSVVSRAFLFSLCILCLLSSTSLTQPSPPSAPSSQFFSLFLLEGMHPLPPSPPPARSADARVTAARSDVVMEFKNQGRSVLAYLPRRSLCVMAGDV